MVGKRPFISSTASEDWGGKDMFVEPGSSANGLKDRRRSVLFPAGCRRLKTGSGAHVLCPPCTEGYCVGAEAVGMWI